MEVTIMMTNNVKVEEKKAAAEKAISELDVALKGANATDIGHKLAAAQVAVAALNEEIIDAYYTEWANADAPLMTAIKAAYMEQYQCKVTEDKETHVKSAKLEQKKADAVLNIKDFDGYAVDVNKGAFFSGNCQWYWLAERVCMLLNRDATKAIGGDLKRFDAKYTISKQALKVNMDADLESKSTAKKAIQAIIDMVLLIDNGKGENTLKVENRDLEFVLACLTKEGRGQDIVVAKPRSFERILVKVMHRQITGTGYDSTYAEKKGN
jgi:autotransporter translocation and assembly factor TamB